MLKLTQLVGFGAGGGGGVDKTPDPFDFTDIFDAGVTAAASTEEITITGIDVPITLRLSLTAPMSAARTVSVFRNGVVVDVASSGTSVDVEMTNGQTLHYLFVNSQDNSIWGGTATVTNLTDGNAVLDAFMFSLQDTGTGGGGGGGVSVSGGVAWEDPP
jgi:hypothetical protein